MSVTPAIARKNIRLSCLISVSCLSFMANAATAQVQAPAEQSKAETVGIEDIVVTAQRRAQNVQDVPIAISAIDSDYIATRDITSIDRLATVSPNVKIERTPSNRTASQISIRGSVTINPAITWEPAVGLYLDGVYIAKAQGSIFDVADLERVEVLRGPQGTLYGRNALAGAINLVTKKPTGNLGGHFEATYGNFDYWRLRGALDLPAFGIFSAKISGQIQKRDGFIKVAPNPFPGLPLAGASPVHRLANLNNKGALIQVRAQPSDSLTFDYSFDYSDFDQRPDQGQLARLNDNGDPRDIFTNPASPGYVGNIFPLDRYVTTGRLDTVSVDAPALFERSKSWGHTLTASLDLGDASTLKSITAYRKLRWDDSLDLDGSPLPVGMSQRLTRYRSFSQEFQLTGKTLSERLNYVAGIYYFDDHAFTNNPQTFLGGILNFDSRYGSDTTAYAAYAQIDYKLLDHVTVTTGIRYTHEKKNIVRLLRLLAEPTIPPALLPLTALDVAKGDVPDAKYNNVTPTVTLQYEPRRALLFYARYAKGFKSGGFNGEASTLDELKNPYRPEKVDSYEVGVKSRLLNNRLQFNAAAFWDEHKDIQLSVFTGRNAAESFVLNAAQARIWGLEFEANAAPSDDLRVAMSLAYLNAKYKKFIDGGVDVADNRAFPQAPKYTASTNVTWTAWRSDHGKLDLIGDISFISEYFNSPYPFKTASPSDQNAYNSRSPGRTIVDVRAVFGDIPLGAIRADVSLWVKNLFDYSAPSNFIDFGPGFGGMSVNFYPDPRTYGITLGAKF